MDTEPLNRAGDLISESIRILSRHPPWFLHLLAPGLFYLSGKILFELPAILTAAELSTPSYIDWFRALSIPLLVFGHIYLSAVSLAISKVVCGLSPDYKRARSEISMKLGQILNGFSITSASILIILILWTLELVAAALLWKAAIPASILGLILGCIGIIGTFIISIPILFMAAIEIAFREGSTLKLLKNAIDIVITRFQSVILITFLLIAVCIAIAYGLSLPFVIVGSLGNLCLESQHSSLPYWIICSQVWDTAVEIVTSPIKFIAFGLLWKEIQNSRNGYDLLNEIESLK